MNISEAMQNEDYYLRIEHRDKWLIGKDGRWIVYQRRMYQRNTRELVNTSDEARAVDVLVRGL